MICVVIFEFFTDKNYALTVDRTQDLQIFSLTLSQLSYQGMKCLGLHDNIISTSI